MHVSLRAAKQMLADGPPSDWARFRQLLSSESTKAREVLASPGQYVVRAAAAGRAVDPQAAAADVVHIMHKLAPGPVTGNWVAAMTSLDECLTAALLFAQPLRSGDTTDAGAVLRAAGQ
jgi:hypothetical protein